MFRRFSKESRKFFYKTNGMRVNRRAIGGKEMRGKNDKKMAF